MSEYCRIERDGHLLTVTINRPEVYNALHPMANQALSDAFDAFAVDPELWVAIITGAGVKRLFQGRYIDREDMRRQLTVRVFELDGPAQAKKLAEAKRPHDAVGEPLGKGGWRGGDGAIGFWGGRYFTHVFANDAARSATLTPQLLAREVGINDSLLATLPEGPVSARHP